MVHKTTFAFFNRTTQGDPGPQGPQKPKTYNFLPILMKFIWQFKKAMVHKTTVAFLNGPHEGDPGPQKAQNLQFSSDLNENYICLFWANHPRAPGPRTLQTYITLTKWTSHPLVYFLYFRILFHIWGHAEQTDKFCKMNTLSN